LDHTDAYATQGIRLIIQGKSVLILMNVSWMTWFAVEDSAGIPQAAFR
jgi:hypothetical protein